MQILVVLIVQISLSGCATVSSVHSIGRRVEILDIPSPSRIYVATNGAVAIEVCATYQTPKWFSKLRYGDPQRLVYSRHKYIIGDRFAVMRSIEMSQEKGFAATNVIIVLTNYHIGSLYAQQWNVYPSQFESDRSTLPENFGVCDNVLTGQFDYYDNGVRYTVYVPTRSILWHQQRVKICWWSLPVSLLSFPALAIDVVTFPIQFFVCDW